MFLQGNLMRLIKEMLPKYPRDTLSKIICLFFRLNCKYSHLELLLVLRTCAVFLNFGFLLTISWNRHFHCWLSPFSCWYSFFSKVLGKLPRRKIASPPALILTLIPKPNPDPDRGAIFRTLYSNYLKSMKWASVWLHYFFCSFHVF